MAIKRKAEEEEKAKNTSTIVNSTNGLALGNKYLQETLLKDIENNKNVQAYKNLAGYTTTMNASMPSVTTTATTVPKSVYSGTASTTSTNKTTSTAPTPVNDLKPPTITNTEDISKGGVIPSTSTTTGKIPTALGPDPETIPETAISTSPAITKGSGSETKEDESDKGNAGDKPNKVPTGDANPPSDTTTGNNTTTGNVTSDVVPSQTWMDAWNQIQKQMGDFKFSRDDEMANLIDTLKTGRTQYSDYVDKYLDAINNREAFNYSANTDPMYQNYLANMQNQGARAMKDTMGQAAALTGGYGSTYATAAANGAYNNYLEQANANLDNYYNMALQAYNLETENLMNAFNSNYQMDSNAYNRNLQQLSNLNNLYNQEYSKWADDFSRNYTVFSDAMTQSNLDREFQNTINQQNQTQANWDKSFNYGVSQDAQTQANWDKSFNYGVSQDQQAQENWEKTYNYTAEQDEKANNLNSAKFYASYGLMPDGVTPLPTTEDATLTEDGYSYSEKDLQKVKTEALQMFMENDIDGMFAFIDSYGMTQTNATDVADYVKRYSGRSDADWDEIISNYINGTNTSKYDFLFKLMYK